MVEMLQTKPVGLEAKVEGMELLLGSQLNGITMLLEIIMRYSQQIIRKLDALNDGIYLG